MYGRNDVGDRLARRFREHPCADPAAPRRPGQPHPDFQAPGLCTLQTQDSGGHVVDDADETDLTDKAIESATPTVMEGDELAHPLRCPGRGAGVSRHHLTSVGVGQGKHHQQRQRLVVQIVEPNLGCHWAETSGGTTSRNSWTRHKLSRGATGELSSLLAGNLLVPVVHGTTYDDLRAESPLLASRDGFSTQEDTPEVIAIKNAELVDWTRPVDA